MLQFAITSPCDNRSNFTHHQNYYNAKISNCQAFPCFFLIYFNLRLVFHPERKKSVDESSTDIRHRLPIGIFFRFVFAVGTDHIVKINLFPTARAFLFRQLGIVLHPAAARSEATVVGSNWIEAVFNTTSRHSSLLAIPPHPRAILQAA